MIEIRFIVDESSVKLALGLAFTMLEEVGGDPLEVRVRDLDQPRP